MNQLLAEQLNNLPRVPGVYLFKDADNRVLYVGKAINLFNRINSYFSSSDYHTDKTMQLVSQIKHIDFIVVDSEQQALIVENNLIKRYRPKYNIRLRDDKTYPYIKIDLSEEWPRVYVTRRILEDKSKYFGPFPNSGAVRNVLGLIEKIFRLKSCSRKLNVKNGRACLNYHIGRCVAPCIQAISKEEYSQLINKITMLIEGREEKIIDELKKEMEKASARCFYEQAATVRDQISALENVISSQKMGLIVRGNRDVISTFQKGDVACATVFKIRNNRLIGRNNFIIEGTMTESKSQILAGFVKQYYAISKDIPCEILLETSIDDSPVISEWLKSLRGRVVKLVVPGRGVKKELIDMVAENARREIERNELLRQFKLNPASILTDLKNVLDLKDAPHRIEGYDISNIQGHFAVGSMVVFEDGKSRRDQYRRFRIKYVEGVDDYAMMRELLRRRLTRHSENTEGWPKPDLILIDGGKGHLNAVLEVMRELKITDIPVISLAKEFEQVFVPGRPEPIDLPLRAPALQLLQRIRDEAHRFGITYHKSVRDRHSFSSVLDEISGIGPKRKKSLIRAFGSVNGIKNAGIEELVKVPGITKNMALVIKQTLAT
jgi:excinuclease ABC subunit C